VKPDEPVIQNFDPHLVMFPSHDVIRVSSRYGDPDVFLERPKGDVYVLLAAATDEIVNQWDPVYSIRLAMLSAVSNVILCIAARDRVMSPEDIRCVEVAHKEHMPIADASWRLLELYRSVARFADADGVELPPILRDEKKAWCQSFLRNIYSCLDMSSSKASHIETQRKYAKALKNKANPFTEDEPEDRALIDWAHKLTAWDNSIQDDLAQLPSHQRKQWYSLRQDIRDNLNKYRSSLTTLATYLKESENLVLYATDKTGAHLVVGPKNKHSQIKTAQFEGGVLEIFSEPD
jgi:hypothetical protein